MTTMLAGPAPFVVLLCLLLVGCGGSKAPPAQTKRDSAASVTAASVPTASSEPVATLSETPVGTSSEVRVRDTVPAMVARVFAAAASVQHLSRPFPHRVIRDSAARMLGYEVFSDSAGVTARGYAGPVPLQVFFDSQGRPVRIYILENCETPAYIEIISGSGLIERLLAFDPAKPDSVDAVTLATTSSHAIIAGVTGLAARVSAELARKPGSGSR